MKRILGILMVLCMAVSIRAESITVSAAISLKESATAIGKAFETDTGDKVEFNFGASGQLVQQITQGAPVDAFISAGQKQIDDLKTAKLAADGPAQIIARNALVLIVPKQAKDAPISFETLAAPSVKRLAVGQPKTVPAGDYAMQTLTALKLDEKLKERLIFGNNVRQVLDYVSRGEVDAGIVYTTDAMEAADTVRVVATAPAESHKPIEYPAILINTSTKQKTGHAFLDYMMTAKAAKDIGG